MIRSRFVALFALAIGCGSSEITPTPGDDASIDGVAPVDGAIDASLDGSPPPSDAAPDANLPPKTTLFGAAFSPHDTTHYDALITLWGGMQVSRSYDGSSGVNPFLNNLQAMDVARKAASAYSFKYPPVDVIAGTHDAALTTFFKGIADDHPVYWTYWHEPDDEIYKTQTFTATQYRDAWAHIRTIADGVKATRPKMIAYATLIIMEYSMTPPIAASRPLLGNNGMYPGDAVIDVFGVDVYNPGAPNGLVTDAATQFGKVIDFAETHKKPWAIGEFGSCPVKNDPNVRTTYLTNAFKYWNLRKNPPAYAAYFDLDWPTCDYRIDTDVPATKVWNTATTQGLGAF